jgi:hypothetical protein
MSKVVLLMHFRGAEPLKEASKPPHPNPSTKERFEVILMTLKQACSSEYQGAQGAFKDSMIH